MGSDMQNLLFTLLIIGASITAFVLLVVFVAVPLFRGIGAGIGLVFRGIGWFFSHIFEFIIGMCSDVIRFVGALIAMIVLTPLVPLNIIIGRWSAAGHFAEGVKRECQVGSACVYRAVIRRPLKLVLLSGLLEGLEQRVPEAMHGAPGSDTPSRRVGQFDGYTILGSLRAGGSGAKLYIAEPLAEKRRKARHMPDRVVIKSFALTEGSSLPQIVRESRALECAKQLGHVLDHGMDEHRFYYVMPYHPGDHLGILTRQMHGECGGRGLDHKRLSQVMSHMRDLLATLSAYHKGGLWHKDVKPENVIVHDGQAHLVDLGLVTPLRSAMTLTTHGTEYFRAPEMVRQALRGVKVHQVNGAKFDIYAAGAVLYFMIENTFPAHGGLSRFAIQNPEALRWIVRRAMTEYHQRYATADEMLADLQHVMTAGDAIAVKPADLPSMSGEAPELDLDEGDEATVAAAQSPQPRSGEPSVGGFGVEASPQSSAQSRRPKLTVTNWWTGEYRAAHDDVADAYDSDAARDFRKQAGSFRHQAEEISRHARVGLISARKAAREQVRAARQRARELRARAMAHRHRIRPHARTSVSTILIGTLSAIFLAGIIITSIFASSASRSDRRYANASVDLERAGLPVLLAVDSSVPLTDSVRTQIKRIANDFRKRGYDVVEDAGDNVAGLLPAIRDWKENPSDQSDEIIENLLASENAYGLVHIPVQKSGRAGRLVVLDTSFVHSTRPDASERRRFSPAQVPNPPASGLPYLLINDHPAKSDIAVAAEIQRQLKVYRDRGWTLVSNDDLEVKVRNVLPMGPIDSTVTLSPMLHTALAEANLGGILRIDGKADSGPLSQRVFLTRIDRDPAVSPQSTEMPAVISAPAAPVAPAMAGSAG